VPRAEHAALPASFGQQRLWFLAQLYPDSPAYNEPIVLQFHEPVDVATLERSLTEIVRRHEAWRTVFCSREGLVYQRVLPPAPFPLRIIDLTALPPERREPEALTQATAESRRLFDLTTGPLVRATLIRLTEEDQRLYVTAHHIVVDGLSFFQVFVPELHALYRAFQSGQPSPLAELPVQFADFAVWQRRWQTDDELAPQLAYWQAQLAEIQALDLPTDARRPPRPPRDGARFPVSLPAPLSEGVRALRRRHGVSQFTVILAAWKTLLYRYTGQKDVTVGTAVAGRRRPELEPLIGFFNNNLVLRTQLEGSLSFADLLARVSHVLLAARSHQDVPFDRLVSQLNVPRQLHETPLFNTMCIVMPPLAALTGAPRWTASRYDIGTAKVDLYLELHQHPDGLRGHIEYRTDLFHEATAARLAGHFQTLLEGAVADPEKPLAELPLLTAAEQRQLKAWQGDTDAATTEDLTCWTQRFEAQVVRTPDAAALVFQDQQLTYRALNERANQLAHHLRRLGVGPEVLVGLCLERSFDMIVGILGIHKAGGAYVPLDPALPAERLRFMIEDTQLSLVLTLRELRHLLPARTLSLDADWAEIAQSPTNDPSPQTAPDHLAYVLYTSGSTGQPKGVLVEHRGISNLVKTHEDLFLVGPGDRVLQFSSFTFDISVGDYAMALPTGATLVLAPRLALVPGADLTRLLREHAITILPLPPSALAALPVEALPSLRALILAGEVCSADLVARWAPGRRFYNAYGPTEATVYTTIAECSEPIETPSIGRPLANVQVYILDSALQQVPVGVPGELFIGGIGVARGYLRRPELTAERFIESPLPEARSSRLYRTGDRVRWRPDGTIDFLGRNDRQVKLRGFRVEPGEIEEVLTQRADLQEAVVVVREDTPGDKRLVAYVVPRPPAGADLVKELSSWLKERLPEYMVPSSIVTMDRLPLSPNSKIDRRALPAPSERRSGPVFEAPQSEAERVIAAIWQGILGRAEIGVRDNFFDIGGHSLRLAEVQARLQAAFRCEVPMLELLRRPTIRDLGAHLSGASSPSEGDAALDAQSERGARQRAALGMGATSSKRRSPGHE
jgi:amino acid adenylation domain-containing protein